MATLSREAFEWMLKVGGQGDKIPGLSALMTEMFAQPMTDSRLGFYTDELKNRGIVLVSTFRCEEVQFAFEREATRPAPVLGLPSTTAPLARVGATGIAMPARAPRPRTLPSSTSPLAVRGRDAGGLTVASAPRTDFRDEYHPRPEWAGGARPMPASTLVDDWGGLEAPRAAATIDDEDRDEEDEDEDEDDSGAYRRSPTPLPREEDRPLSYSPSPAAPLATTRSSSNAPLWAVAAIVAFGLIGFIVAYLATH